MSDVVNHPSHYQGKVECIDCLEAATEGLEGIEAVCTANAIKYLYRWKKKNGIEDLRKCSWYLNRLINTLVFRASAPAAEIPNIDGHQGETEGEDALMEALDWREDRQSITYQLDPGAYKPTKAHPSDAGYDLYARMDVELAAGGTVRVDTGVHVLIPDGYVGLVQPCSSYSDAGVLAAGSTVRVDTGAHGLIPDGYVGLVQPRSSYSAAGVGTVTGVIDAGYTGSISVVLSSKSDLKIYAGSRIAQLVIVPLPGVRLVEGDVMSHKSDVMSHKSDVMSHKSERGCGGFGSTGR